MTHSIDTHLYPSETLHSQGFETEVIFAQKESWNEVFVYLFTLELLHCFWMLYLESTKHLEEQQARVVRDLNSLTTATCQCMPCKMRWKGNLRSSLDRYSSQTKE